MSHQHPENGGQPDGPASTLRSRPSHPSEDTNVPVTVNTEDLTYSSHLQKAVPDDHGGQIHVHAPQYSIRIVTRDSEHEPGQRVHPADGAPARVVGGGWGGLSPGAHTSVPEHRQNASGGPGWFFSVHEKMMYSLEVEWKWSERVQSSETLQPSASAQAAVTMGCWRRSHRCSKRDSHFKPARFFHIFISIAVKSGHRHVLGTNVSQHRVSRFLLLHHRP